MNSTTKILMRSKPILSELISGIISQLFIFSHKIIAFLTNLNKAGGKKNGNHQETRLYFCFSFLGGFQQKNQAAIAQIFFPFSRTDAVLGGMLERLAFFAADAAGNASIDVDQIII